MQSTLNPRAQSWFPSNAQTKKLAQSPKATTVTISTAAATTTSLSSPSKQVRFNLDANSVFEIPREPRRDDAVSVTVDLAEIARSGGSPPEHAVLAGTMGRLGHVDTDHAQVWFHTTKGLCSHVVPFAQLLLLQTT